MTSQPQQISTILVGVDGSPDSDAATEFAVRLASQLRADLLFVHAVGMTERDDDGEIVPSQSILDVLANRIRRIWTAPAQAAIVPFRTALENGPPTMAIARVANAESVDLIVVGHRGSGSSTSLYGSTSHYLVETSPIPVLCIRAAPLVEADPSVSMKPAEINPTEMSIP